MTFILFFLLTTDERPENSTQSCERAVQRLTKTGGDFNFSQKEKEPVSEEVQMLMTSYDLLYWVIVQILWCTFFISILLLSFIHLFINI